MGPTLELRNKLPMRAGVVLQVESHGILLCSPSPVGTSSTVCQLCDCREMT